MNIGFIGLGHMGSGMAANLLKAGHHVTVYNRSPGKAEALVSVGAKAAPDIASACRGEAVISMLADDIAVEDVVLSRDGVIANLAAGALHISSSSISVALSRRLADAHRKADQLFVAAPVFGRPDVAAARRLTIVAAGAPAAFQIATPLLNALGQKTLFVSQTPEVANLIKLSGNFLLACVIEALGEAFALTAKAGVNKQHYLEIVTSALFDTPTYRTYGGLIANGGFEPAAFSATLGHKDIRLALQAAEELRVPMPMASVVHDRFLTLLANGNGQLDWSALGGLAAQNAGLPTA